MLRTGKTLCSKRSYVRDLEPILDACANHGVRLLVSSAGGAGTNQQVGQLVEIVKEIAEAYCWQFKVSTIKFDDDRELFLNKLRAGKTKSCSSSPELSEDDIRDAVTVVAQMGAEPFMKVLKDDNPDIIIAARSCDPAPFAAYCIGKGVQKSLAWHVGKIAECGGLCTVPKGRSILVTMFQDRFVLTPTDTATKCSAVLLHGAYEGQVATAGNLASPLTPLETPLGLVFKFSIYHLMEIDETCSLFPSESFVLGKAEQPGSITSSTNGSRRKTVATSAKLVEDAKKSGAAAVAKRKIAGCSTAIQNLASVVRSKNSGPFEITLDVLFASRENYERVRASNVVTPELIGKLYRLSSSLEVIVCMFFKPALAWKCTFRRPWAQGSLGERDTFGAQLHVPLLSISIDEEPAHAKL